MRRAKTGTRAVCLGALLLVSATVLLPAREPAGERTALKPQWQRYLQAEDARKAAEGEKQLAQLQEVGKFEDALKVAEGLAKLRSEVQGVDHWETVNARLVVETLRRVLRQGQEARSAYAGSFVLDRQANTLSKKGRYREAHPFFEKVLAIRQQVLGEEHFLTGAAHNSLAVNLSAQDKHGKAEQNALKGLLICRKVMGDKHPDTAAGYHNLASYLNHQGKYAEAEQSYRKGLAISREVMGEDDLYTANNYGGLASCFRDQGRYVEAEQENCKALAIRRKVLGEEHTDTAVSYNNLAANLNSQGKHADAQQYCRKALAIRRKVLGEEHPLTAQSYNNVSYNLNAQGKYVEAEEGYRKAFAICRKVLGAEHSQTITNFLNLANNLARLGKYAEAEQGLRQVLAICRKYRGDEHPFLANTYQSLATNLCSQRKLDEAEQIGRKALTIRRKMLGEEHPLTAQTYNTFAYILSDQGKYAEAEQNGRKALAIRCKMLGEEHSYTANSYKNVAQNLYAQGKYVEAEELWLRAADSFAKARLRITDSGLDRAIRTTEASPLTFLASVLARNGKPEEAWQRFEESLARGTWDDLAARLRRPAAEQAKQIQLATRLDRLDQLIQRMHSANEPTPEQKKRREELLMQRRQTQEELDVFVRHLEKTYGPIAEQVFNRPQIQVALPADAALISWLDIRGQPKAADPNGEHWAVLLRRKGPPVWVRLRGSGEDGSWTDADNRLPDQMRAALQSSTGKWQPMAQKLRKQRLQPLSEHLDAANGLPAVRHLIVLPSPALAGVPVESFTDDYTISYALSGTLHAHLHKQPKVSSKRLLALADPIFDSPAENDKPMPLPPGGVLITAVIPRSNAAGSGLKPNDVLLRYGDKDLAGPAEFQATLDSNAGDKPIPVTVWRDGKALSRPVLLRPGKLGAVTADKPAPEALAELRRLNRRLASTRGDKWDELPGTRIEAESLARLFTEDSSRLLLDSEASEQQLYELAKTNQLGEYRYLHLATHGDVDNTAPLRSTIILSRDHLPDPGKQLDAGLPIFDGRLTAREVLEQWHLNSELVTLSACQTALGKYERGEGFVGFAQALILSGSRGVCLSLWKVDDTATALLMERFYQNLLGKRDGLRGPMPKGAALAEAKAWLRDLPREEALKRVASLSKGVARGKGRKELPPLAEAPGKTPKLKGDRPYAHPYYWAAFVLLGDPD